MNNSTKEALFKKFNTAKAEYFAEANLPEMAKMWPLIIPDVSAIPENANKPFWEINVICQNIFGEWLKNNT